jgi:hypothetical protein
MGADCPLPHTSGPHHRRSRHFCTQRNPQPKVLPTAVCSTLLCPIYFQRGGCSGTLHVGPDFVQGSQERLGWPAIARKILRLVVWKKIQEFSSQNTLDENTGIFIRKKSLDY